ncbi:hypothetical protein DSL72_009464 [Monilinia vaccinii-corymbosi]|uniref:Uncharacterized protein n=1 Tax=Monilinia vaccinii-corymbosi TaxID=61207 RepID=A0A8A3PRE9_9HELO|nr:hypothetical protein DSL72_009464 [Monilinia vaccinii-corymbosi]
MILLSQAFDPSRIVSYLRIDYPRLNVKETNGGILIDQVVPEAHNARFGRAVGREPRDGVEVYGVGGRIDDDGILRCVLEECLGDGQGPAEALAHVVEEGVGLQVADARQGSEGGGVAHEHVDFARLCLCLGADELPKGGVDLVGLLDVGRDGEDGGLWELLLDGGFGGEERLFASSEEPDSGGSGAGEVEGCFGADAAAAAGYEDALAAG